MHPAPGSDPPGDTRARLRACDHLRVAHEVRAGPTRLSGATAPTPVPTPTWAVSEGSVRKAFRDLRLQLWCHCEEGGGGAGERVATTPSPLPPHARALVARRACETGVEGGDGNGEGSKAETEEGAPQALAAPTTALHSLRRCRIPVGGVAPAHQWRAVLLDQRVWRRAPGVGGEASRLGQKPGGQGSDRAVGAPGSETWAENSGERGPVDAGRGGTSE